MKLIIEMNLDTRSTPHKIVEELHGLCQALSLLPDVDLRCLLKQRDERLMFEGQDENGPVHARVRATTEPFNATATESVFKEEVVRIPPKENPQ